MLAVRHLARLARPLVERIPASSGKASFDYKAKRFVRAAHLPPLERHHAWKEIFSADARAELLASGQRGALDPLDLLRARYAETAGAEPLARLQDVDLGVRAVEPEGSPGCCRDAEVIHDGLRAVMTGAARHTFLVEDRRDIVRVNPFEQEGDDGQQYQCDQPGQPLEKDACHRLGLGLDLPAEGVSPTPMKFR